MAIEKILGEKEYTAILDTPIKYFNKAMLEELKLNLDVGQHAKKEIGAGSTVCAPTSKGGQMIMMRLEERRVYSKLEMLGKQVIK